MNLSWFRKTFNKKTSLVILSIFLIIGCLVGGTLAWLTARSNSVINTFSGSNLTINLAETAADDSTTTEGRTYTSIMPGDLLAKDPTVTVEAGSEPAYVFLKVDESADFDQYAHYYIENIWEPYVGFKIDGIKDSYYSDDPAYHYDSRVDSSDIEAYYSDSTKQTDANGNALFYNDNATYAQTYGQAGGIEHAVEFWTAYDDNYVYVYAKIYDAEYKKYTNTNTNQSDSFAIYFDPDPDSHTNIDITKYTDIEEYTQIENDQFADHTRISEQGDLSLSTYPGTTLESDTTYPLISAVPQAKPGYSNGRKADPTVNPGTDSAVDYFRNGWEYKESQGKNYCYFELDENNDSVYDGYGIEVRFPRNNDSTGSYKLNIAAASYNETYTEQCTLSFSNNWWLDYNGMIKIPYNDATNPFLSGDENYQKYKNYYYKVVGDLETGPLTADETLQILRSGYAYDPTNGTYTKGYVQIRSELNDEITQLSADNNVTLSFSACAIQQAHLEKLEDAFNLARQQLESTTS